jgi:hypothetical protein
MPSSQENVDMNLALFKIDDEILDTATFADEIVRAHSV